MGQFPGKVDNSTISTKICPKNGFRFEISQKFCQNKNQHPGGLGLEVQKTNVQIRINILEIQFSFKTTLVIFKNFKISKFSKICPKKKFGSKVRTNNFGIKISILQIPSVSIFRQNGHFLVFRPKFTQKFISRSEFQKFKSGFGINTSKIPCKPVFSQSEQF